MKRGGERGGSKEGVFLCSTSRYVHLACHEHMHTGGWIQWMDAVDGYSGWMQWMDTVDGCSGWMHSDECMQDRKSTHACAPSACMHACMGTCADARLCPISMHACMHAWDTVCKNAHACMETEMGEGARCFPFGRTSGMDGWMHMTLEAHSIAWLLLSSPFTQCPLCLCR
eukprot:278984-Chlamydomonas_euryale.AAC.3